jgi:hypothetical protein
VSRPIVISGTLQEVKQKLLALQAIIRNREVTGWRPLMNDETWLYVTAQDDRVCVSVCVPLDSRVFKGDLLASRFPNAVFVDATTIKMNTHHPRDAHCRCFAFWINASEVITERLRTELAEAVGVV